MKVLEQASHPKTGNPELNEDFLVITPDFIAVLDGSTSKSGKKINGMTGGAFASRLGGDVIAKLPADIDGMSAISALTEALASAVFDSGLFTPQEEPPAFVAAIYSRHRREIWRVGDVAVLVDGVLSLNEKGADVLASDMRAMVIAMAIEKGATLEDLAREDVGRQAILPLLRDYHLFGNREHEYGFGIINGREIPDSFIQIMHVPEAKHIVLASDGYPYLFGTLEASEAKLAEILATDPLLCTAFKATKGVQAGNVSFDDRTYVSFEL